MISIRIDIRTRIALSVCDRSFIHKHRRIRRSVRLIRVGIIHHRVRYNFYISVIS